MPVILIHGAGSDHLCWPAEIRRMTGERTLAVDLPGHGRSGGVSEQSVKGYADQLFPFLDAMHIYRAMLVGHSLGGAVALQAALTQPKRIAALGLISSGASFKVPAGLLQALSSEVTLPQAMNLLRSHLFGKVAPRDLVEKTMNAFKKVRLSQLRSDWKAAENFDVCGLLSRIDMPVWIGVGEDDQLTPPSMSHYLASHLKKSELLTVPEAGHMLILERPNIVGERLKDFIHFLPLDLA